MLSEQLQYSREGFSKRHFFRPIKREGMPRLRAPIQIYIFIDVGLCARPGEVRSSGRANPLERYSLNIGTNRRWALKALKTLRFERGRVSIDPEEVLHRPSYLDARFAAPVLIREPGRVWNWEAVDEVSLALLRATPSNPTCVRLAETASTNEAAPASVDGNIEEEVMVLGRVDRRLRDTRVSNCKR